MYHIAEGTNLRIDTTERILFAMMDLGHVIRFRDRGNNNKTRFRLFSPEGPPQKSVRRGPPNSNRKQSPGGESN